MPIFTCSTAIVNFPSLRPVEDDYRPTSGPDFEPSAEEQAEAAELLNSDFEPDWESMAGASAAMDLVCGWAVHA